jgi:hypothetical protein
LKTFDFDQKWEELFEEEMSSTRKRTDLPVEQWRVAGRATKANPNKEDLKWWKENGLEHVKDYAKWFAKTGWSIAQMPDGKPGIEWEAEVEFAGIPVRLIVDAIYTDGSNLIVVDYKTGSRDPKGYLQLGLYASAIEKTFGVRPKFGGYYMTRKAALTGLIDLSPWPISFFDYQVSAMDAYRETGYYPPNVGDTCNICSFSDYCQAVGGSKSKDYPLIQITTKKEK